MKRRTMRILAIIFALFMLLSIVAFAAQESSAYIAATNGYITYSGNNVNVYFSVVGSYPMNEIGVSEILLFEKNGNVWTRVYIFDANDPAYTSDMLSYNTSAKADHVTYSGDSTKSYFAILYFYAADNYGSDTIIYYT